MNYSFTEVAAAHSEPNEALRQKKLGDLDRETIPFYLRKFDIAAKENNGYLALGRVSLPIHFKSISFSLEKFWSFFLVDVG